MELTIIEENLSDYNQAIEYTNTTLVNSNQFSDEQWKQYYMHLFKWGPKGLLGYQMQKYVVNKDWNVFWDLFFDFVKLVINETCMMNDQLNFFRSEMEDPGEKFMQWLLTDCVKKIVFEYRKNNQSRKLGATRECNLRLIFDSGEIVKINA